MHTNVNFPAVFAVLAVFGSALAIVVLIALFTVALVTRRRALAARVTLAFAVGALLYLALLFGFSLASRNQTLARGEEKYFCEIDCHLAYSVQGVSETSALGAGPALVNANGRFVIVDLRTRFDETTISSHRPKDAPLAPSPRLTYLIDTDGRVVPPAGRAEQALIAANGDGTPLSRELRPGESYVTRLIFDVPNDRVSDLARLRLGVFTQPAWIDRLVIGDENSLLHGKTYLALR
jgi:hypothetical protein